VRSPEFGDDVSPGVGPGSGRASSDALSGLRVVDASIIPVVPSVAINPTTIMVAERIAKTAYAGSLRET
jgi:GMC oxidoreductase